MDEGERALPCARESLELGRRDALCLRVDFIRMPLGGSGFLTEAVLGKANEKLEQAIEDLRIKYEKKAQVEAEAAAAKAKEKAAEVEGKKSTEPEMSMEDPELEALRQVGGSTVDVETWAWLSFFWKLPPLLDGIAH